MPKVIRLSSDLVMQAKVAGDASGRSPSQQIHYWVRLGKLAEDSPELTPKALLDILNSKSLKFNNH
jgi:hypothetical protein